MKSPASPRPAPTQPMISSDRRARWRQSASRQRTFQAAFRCPPSLLIPHSSPHVHPWRPCPSRAPAVPVCVRERCTRLLFLSRTDDQSKHVRRSFHAIRGRTAGLWSWSSCDGMALAWQAEAGAGTERLPHHSYYCPALALPLLARFWQLNLCSVRLDIGYIHAANSNSNGNGRQLTGPWGCVCVSTYSTDQPRMRDASIWLGSTTHHMHALPLPGITRKWMPNYIHLLSSLSSLESWLCLIVITFHCLYSIHSLPMQTGAQAQPKPGFIWKEG
jgi:hypothetical protein